MKVFIIPDIHLKPWMFTSATELIKKTNPDGIVCLMDIPDDFKQQYNIDLYINTFDVATQFAKEFPQTLWCYGNHDLSYLWDQMETGYSYVAKYAAHDGIRKLRNAIPDISQLAYIHRIDNILFLHGGLYEMFVKKYVPKKLA